eukprot:92299-Amphidinium_carterae.1
MAQGPKCDEDDQGVPLRRAFVIVLGTVGACATSRAAACATKSSMMTGVAGAFHPPPGVLQIGALQRS